MIIESAVESAIPRIMHKKDCTLLREEEISGMLSKGCETYLSSLGVPNHTKYVEVEKLYPDSSSRIEKRADLFIDKDAIIHFTPSTAEIHHNIWTECKFLKHDKEIWNIESLITDIRRLLTRGKAFGYFVVLFEYDLEKHQQNDSDLESIQSILLDISKPSCLSLYDEKENLEEDKDIPFTSAGQNKIEIKLRRNFSDVFPLEFKEGEKYYRFVTIKIFAENYNCRGYFF